MIPFVYRPKRGMIAGFHDVRVCYIYIWSCNTENPKFTRHIQYNISSSLPILSLLTLLVPFRLIRSSAPSPIKALRLLCACGKQKLSYECHYLPSSLCQYAMRWGLFISRVKHDFPSKGLLLLWRSNTTNRKKIITSIYIYRYTYECKYKSYTVTISVCKSSGVQL